MENIERGEQNLEQPSKGISEILTETIVRLPEEDRTEILTGAILYRLSEEERTEIIKETLSILRLPQEDVPEIITKIVSRSPQEDVPEIIKETVLRFPEEERTEIVEMFIDNGHIADALAALKIIPGEDRTEIANKMVDNGKYEDVFLVRWTLPEEDRTEIARKMIDKGDYEYVVFMLPVLPEEDRTEIAKMFIDKGGYLEYWAVMEYLSNDFFPEKDSKGIVMEVIDKNYQRDPSDRRIYGKVIAILYRLSEEDRTEITNKLIAVGIGEYKERMYAEINRINKQDKNAS